MNRLALGVVLVALGGAAALAQESAPRFQAFGGYSFFHADNAGVTGAKLGEDLKERNHPFGTASNFTGWNAEAQYNFSRSIGIAVDGGGRYGSPITGSRFNKLSGLPGADAYTFLVGPVFSFSGKSRFTPFLHVLLGYDRMQLKASSIGGLTNPVSSVATTYTDFAMALGGGIDYRLRRHVSLRLAQADLLETTHNLNHFYASAFPTGVFESFGTRQRNVRLSTGIVMRF